MIRLMDARTGIKDLDGAKTTMREVAEITARLAVDKAKLEQKITALKSAHAERVAGSEQSLKERMESLAHFILQNRQLFQKPRKIKTDFGSFGLQAVSEILVNDEQAFIQFCLDNGHDDLVKVIRTPVLSAVEARLDNGQTLPGVSRNSGDTAVCKVSRSYIDSVLEHEESDAERSA